MTGWGQKYTCKGRGDDAGCVRQRRGRSLRAHLENAAGRRHPGPQALERRLHPPQSAAASGRGRRQLNLIIRPTSPRGFFLQLDDLRPEILERVKPVSLLTLATSPGKAQAWLFVEGKGDADSDRDFRRRAKKALRGRDRWRTGAVRLAGSVNFKPKYAPDFPRVAIITHAAPGLMTSRERLDELGLVAAPDPFLRPRVFP